MIILIEILLLPILLFLPGYVILSGDTRLDDAERVALSLGVSVFIFGLVSLVIHSFGGLLTIYNVIIPVFLILAIFCIICRPELKIPYIGRWLLVIFILSFMLKVFLIPLNEFPESGDTYVHYLSAKSFLTDNWFTSNLINNFWTPYHSFPFPENYRPPLYNFILGVSMVFFGVKLTTAQLTTTLFGAFLIFPAYLIAKKLFNEKIAVLSALFIAINPFLITMSIEVQPRVMPIYFVLLTFYFVLKGRDYWLYFTTSAAFAYLTHYTAIWFLIPIGIYFIIQNRNFPRTKEVYYSAILFFLILLPWLLRNYLLFGNPIYSTAGYVPIMYHWEVYGSLTPPTLDSYVAHFGGGIIAWMKIIGIRLINIITSYVPPPHKAIEYGIVWVLSYPLIGIVSPIVLLFGILYLLTLLKNKEFINPIVLTIIFASITAPLIPGYPRSNGVSSDSLTPMIPLFTILAIAWVCNHKYNNYVLLFLFLTVIIQNGIIFTDRYLHEFNNEIVEWVKDNTSENSIIMSLEAHRFVFYTDRYGIVTPLANKDDIYRTISNYSVDYFIVSPADIRFRDIDLEELNKKYGLLYNEGGYYIFKTS